MRRLVTSRLIRIYTVCNYAIDFDLNPYLQQWMYQSWKSPCQKLVGERVKPGLGM